jgi:rubrerythrin
MIQLLHRWIWCNAERRARKLLNFAETEADGGRDLVHAAELTQDPTLRRLYIVHAKDEQRHAALLRQRGATLLRSLPLRSQPVFQLNWVSPGERGLDDLRVAGESDASLLAFLHLSETAAARHFAIYCDVLHDDPRTRAVFKEILRDERFHMNYTLSQLTRVAPNRRPMLLWRARFGRLWKGYLRMMSAIASVIGTVILTLQYFILLPPFAMLAKRAERREPQGCTQISPKYKDSLESQY